MKAIVLTVCLWSSGVGYTQKIISNQTHGWVMYFGNHKFSDRWGIHTEYQWRRAADEHASNPIEHWQQSLLRVGVDYFTRNQLQLTSGYGWIKTYPYGDQPVSHDFNEHRIWQQLILKNKLGRVELQHRYRLEQRFIEQYVHTTNGTFTQAGYVFRNRFRYLFRITVPLNRKEMANNTLFLTMYDELFLGFGKGIGKNVLDQNRIYAALGWRFNSNLNIQLGYLNQYLIKSDGIHQERDHTLQLGITYNLDLRKKN